MSKKKNQVPIYDFSSFTEEKARRAFNLKIELEPKGYLDDWLNNANNNEVTPEEKKQLERLQRKLNLFVRGWNEQELREKFIIPVVEIVDFDLYDLEVVAFAERDMKASYHNSIIQGKVEWMVANGLFEPQHPFFFIHEYKKEKDASNDPVGQLLATLFAAQTLNAQKTEISLFNPEITSFSHFPIYGSYVVGRFWFFVRLKDHRYYISKSYDSTDMEDLEFILKMLKAQKEMIIKLILEMREEEVVG